MREEKYSTGYYLPAFFSNAEGKLILVPPPNRDRRQEVGVEIKDRQSGIYQHSRSDWGEGRALIVFCLVLIYYTNSIFHWYVSF